MNKGMVKTGLRIGDWWLIAIFTVLIMQSVYGLFYPLPAGNTVETIDIVFRTSKAAIFGYIISSNFGRRKKLYEDTTSATSTAIGFEVPADAQPTASADGKRTVSAEPVVLQVKTKQKRRKNVNVQQLTLVGIIGLVSLIVLIVWRNFYGRSGVTTTGMTAVVSQFRDMLSGCVGFLIGQPQTSSEGDG